MTKHSQAEIVEQEGDLFESAESLCHCVSQCLHMGAGIAVAFKRLFGRVDELKAQHAAPGGVAVLWDDAKERHVYYLVTKARYFHKPTYDSLRGSLEAMKAHAVEHGVGAISMPRIGCGLDGLEWPRVKTMLRQVFAGTTIRLTVYRPYSNR